MAITKRQVLEALNKVNFTEEIDLGEDIVVTPEDIKNFIEKSLTQLDARNVKAAERAAQKKIEGDNIRAAIKAVITDTPKTLAEIVDAVNDPDLTNAKIVARLTQLVNLGEVFKSEIKIDGRVLKTYSTIEQ